MPTYMNGSRVIKPFAFIWCFQLHKLRYTVEKVVFVIVSIRVTNIKENNSIPLINN